LSSTFKLPCCRYKKIVDANKQTGRGKSTWEFMDVLRPILDKDPAVNPPCILSAGCVAATHEEDVPAPVLQASGSGTAATSKKGSRKRKNELSESLDRFTEAANNRHKNTVKELQELVQAEKRKNDLFEKFLDTFTKK